MFNSLTSPSAHRKEIDNFIGVKGFAVTLYLIISCFLAYSQPITPEAELDYITEEFTLPGGRLGNNVNCIVQGPYGFIWFGSHAGLHRYDGFEFVTYKNVPGDTVGETTSLTFPYVEGLYWDSANMLWVATYGGGLYRFNPMTETFKHFAHDPEDSTSISHQRVLCAGEDANGQMWFGTEGGLNRFDRKTEKFTRYYADQNVKDALYDDDIRTLYVDKQGTLWAGTGFLLWGTSPGALSRYDPEKDSFVNYRLDPDGSSSVRGILEDNSGNFWVGAEKGLYKMNREKGTFQLMTNNPAKPFAPGTNSRTLPAVYSILEDHKGGLWIGTIAEPNYSTHLLRYDTVLRKSQVFPIQSEAWQLCESKDGTIWVAGAGGSGKVLKIRPKLKTYDLLHTYSFQDAFNKSALSKELKSSFSILGPVNMVVDPATGNYWFQMVLSDGTTRFESLLANYNPESDDISFHNLPELKLLWSGSIASQIGISGLLIDKAGTVWGSYPTPNVGIFNYDPKTRKVIQYLHDPDDPASLISNDIVTIIMDRNGDIWAATFGNGVDRLNPSTGKITHYHFNKVGFGENDDPISLMETSDGKMWVAGDLINDGSPFVAIIDPNSGKMEKLNVPRTGRFNITSMAQSPVTGQVIFTGNQGGILLYNRDEDNEFSFIGTENGFPFESAAGVVCDKEGVFWITDSESRTWVRFSGFQNDLVFQASDGAPARERNGTLGPNGHIFFTSWAGSWIEIDPDKIKPEISSTFSEVHLVDLYILGEKQKPDERTLLPKPLWMLNELSLPSSAETFSFRFSDFDYQNKSPQFLYRLFPYETNWKKSGRTQIANYYKLPSGQYTFEVKSLNQRAIDDELITTLRVVILPPWWRTWWAYGSYSLMFIGGIFVVDRTQRKRLLAKANAEAREKELVQARKIEKAYTELKATQSQLIQSEKMASLGELTAGIAHEIQNPLNFVNNFSEVNEELLNEMKEELSNGKIEDAVALANDAIENQKKIYHHGKRADAIVKGMLQHSRGGNDVKEPTDINALADEYLRLAYHGLRAKDKSFNATMKTDFDEALDKINVVPQDIGRVILNLITNAFYAVSEKAKQNSDGAFAPTVTVGTKRIDNGIEVSVSDNGNGIPDSVKEKIFQPFFTTKPTGQGTGLGLSMSYDIIKSHGGEILVRSNLNEGTEFAIKIPLN